MGHSGSSGAGSNVPRCCAAARADAGVHSFKKLRERPGADASMATGSGISGAVNGCVAPSKLQALLRFAGHFASHWFP